VGLFGKKKELARGTARVVSVNAAPHATHSSLKMDLVVEVPGIAAYAHEYRKRVMAIAKWPSPGQVVPVMVDRNDHDDVDVLWDEVPTGAVLAKQQTEQMAAFLRGEQVHDPAETSAVGDLVTSLQRMFPDATINVGDDMSTPTVVTPGQFNAVASQSNADPVERLDKLAKLRAAGVIDDDQFAQLRAQILGQAGID
jgi:hypothetical protein